MFPGIALFFALDGWKSAFESPTADYNLRQSAL
jgi:hypothetical protein